MSAKNRRNSSHTWRAMLYGHEALSLGLIKRTRDGANIRIWEDPWIPTNPSLKPIIRLPDSNVLMVQ
jgi:hypothetical protein